MIYAAMSGDYYPISWDAGGFKRQCNTLINDPKTYLGSTEEGFIRLTLIQKVIQIIKRFLGATDYTDQYRVHGALLKFIYYGEAHGFFYKHQLSRLQTRLSYPAKSIDPLVDRLFQEVNNYYQNTHRISNSEYLKKIRDIVHEYHWIHEASLMPSFWARWRAPSAPLKKPCEFGATPLKLSKNALEKETSEPLEALLYIKKAFEVKNDSREFQKKIGKQLEDLEVRCLLALVDHRLEIQELWIELAKIGFANGEVQQAKSYLLRALNLDEKNPEIRIQIGKLYLKNREYQSAGPFLEEMQTTFSEDPEILKEIGHAFWEKNQYDKALRAYELTLDSYKNHQCLLVPHQKLIALMNHRIGMIYFEGLLGIGQENAEKAIPFFSLAIKQDSNTKDYQKALCKAFIQLSDDLKKQFPIKYSNVLIEFLEIADSSVIEEFAAKIFTLLIECSEHYFLTLQNREARIFIEKICTLFNGQIDWMIESLDLAIRFHDWTFLEKNFSKWQKENYSNPFLNATIGDAYWKSSNTNLALQSYKEALRLFRNRLSNCANDEERNLCSLRMADIQVKIGKNKFKGKGKSLNTQGVKDGIADLEDAARLNPAYNSLLFKAYVIAAKEENKRIWPLRKDDKIIEYYLKAFQVTTQNHVCFGELMTLLLENNRTDEAVDLYFEIQKKTWSNGFQFTSKGYSDLAEALSKKSKSMASFECRKKAFELETKNLDYKKKYFIEALLIADKFLKKIGPDELDANQIEELIKIAATLDECWQHGFQNISPLAQSFKNTFEGIYKILAYQKMESVWLSYPMNGKDLSVHQKKFKGQIDQAIEYFNKGLQYHPKSSILHFELGLIHEWLVQYDLALKSYKKAIEHQPNNLFYHKLAGSLCSVLDGRFDEKEEHDKFIEKYGSDTFLGDYQLWNRNHMLKVKSSIDPHSYTKKTSWFG